ncbi:hypothetical protein FA13DRAFT_1726973 [Coprinellus micaceus]|uniref:Uncharacterized protein n=1 Tax=Coprinellus micaceus TaxID=71717 RepID=A0A4Y7TQY9_COPMI|nr:hypothetical protein FA13DRAFT_1726973 [Coprinellus micaceus]
MGPWAGSWTVRPNSTWARGLGETGTFMGIGETLSPHSLCSSPEQSNPSREFGSHPPIIDMPEREGVYEPGQLSSREHPRITLAAKMGV